MLGQGKTVFQAEIDAACELIDFWRFNVHYATEIYREQPDASAGVWNRTDYRPLEGVVFAVTPFNFTSIAGNLPTAPALMGGVTIWKPASSAMLSAYYVMQVLMEAGLPPGVINFVPGDPRVVSRRSCSRRRTWRAFISPAAPTCSGRSGATVGENIGRYRSYPRLVGETGGKDFIVAHASADPLTRWPWRSCAAGSNIRDRSVRPPSRVYVPQSLWKPVRDRVVAMIDAHRDGRRARFQKFHERRHRSPRVRPDSRAPSRRAPIGDDRAWGQAGRSRRLFHLADVRPGGRIPPTG